MDGDTVTTERIISCAIEVHKYLGPGLLESVYESALCVEFKANSLPFKRQMGVPLECIDSRVNARSASAGASRSDRKRHGVLFRRLRSLPLAPAPGPRAG